MIIDTDVLIWHLRGNQNAQKIIAANIPFRISVISYLELIQGVSNKKDLRLLQKQILNWAAEILQINEKISTRAMFLVENFYLNHSMEYGDAIITTTAIENNDILLTGNDRHYNFIPDLKIIKFKK